MSYLVFARKYRPQTFEEVVRQDHVTRTLANAISAGRVAHAILFTGPRGTGKTTVARILAKAMNCEKGPTPIPCNSCPSCMEITNGHSGDVFEIDGASNNSVDQVRELRDNLKYMPVHSRFKIYIIDEVHMLSLAAFNALLKTLEEPPEHVLFMFATTEAHKIPVTILSRCQRHDLRRIEACAIVEQLRRICDQERVAMDDPSLSLIAHEAGGSMRDALSLLDHVLACGQGTVSEQLISDTLGLVERRHLFDISAAVFARDIQGVLAKIDLIWRQGYEIKRFYSDLVTHFHHLAFIKLGSQAAGLIDLPGQDIKQMQMQTADVPASFLTQVFDLLFQAEPSIKLSAQPRLALEMIFLKLFQTPPSLPIETLIAKLDELQSRQLRSGEPAQSQPSCAQHDSTEHDSLEQRTQSIGHHDADASAGENVAPSLEGPMTVDDFWQRVMIQVESEKPSLAALLKKCRLKAGEGEQFGIEVSGNDYAFKTITRQVPLLEKICTAAAGRAVRVHISTAVEDAAVKEREKTKNSRLKQKALSDPIVMAALEIFDGKVIDIKLIQEA